MFKKRTVKEVQASRDRKLKDNSPEEYKRRLKHRAWNKKWREKNPEKVKAGAFINHHAKQCPLGPCCEFCGSKRDLQRHHPDYSKPEEYVTLCSYCHKVENDKNRRKKT